MRSYEYRGGDFRLEIADKPLQRRQCSGGATHHDDGEFRRGFLFH
jgi:hypothetical protein